MLINQQITDDLKSNVWSLDWKDFCDDKAKYTTDETFLISRIPAAENCWRI